MHSLKFHMQEADSLAAVRTDLFSPEAAGADRAAVQLRNCISQCGPVVIQTGTITKQQPPAAPATQKQYPVHRVPHLPRKTARGPGGDR